MFEHNSELKTMPILKPLDDHEIRFVMLVADPESPLRMYKTLQARRLGAAKILGMLTDKGKPMGPEESDIINGMNSRVESAIEFYIDTFVDEESIADCAAAVLVFMNNCNSIMSKKVTINTDNNSISRSEASIFNQAKDIVKYGLLDKATKEMRALMESLSFKPDLRTALNEGEIMVVPTVNRKHGPEPKAVEADDMKIPGFNEALDVDQEEETRNIPNVGERKFD